MPSHWSRGHRCVLCRKSSNSGLCGRTGAPRIKERVLQGHLGALLSQRAKSFFAQGLWEGWPEKYVISDYLSGWRNRKVVS